MRVIEGDAQHAEALLACLATGAPVCKCLRPVACLIRAVLPAIDEHQQATLEVAHLGPNAPIEDDCVHADVAQQGTTRQKGLHLMRKAAPRAADGILIHVLNQQLLLFRQVFDWPVLAVLCGKLATCIIVIANATCQHPREPN